MKNTEKKNPYQTMAFGKITAPHADNSQSPKTTKKVGKGDLRTGGKK
jgi:hypothetical protein